MFRTSLLSASSTIWNRRHHTAQTTYPLQVEASGIWG